LQPVGLTDYLIVNIGTSSAGGAACLAHPRHRIVVRRKAPHGLDFLPPV